jgi:hypothetical protein
MLKVRLQGTTKDIKWFLKILERDKRFMTNEPSRPLDIKGSEKYKRVFSYIFWSARLNTSSTEVSVPGV